MEKKVYPHYLQRLQDATRKYWDKPALNTLGGDSFTYSQMATDIARFHIVFEKAGFKKGDKIALCANNGAKWGFAYLAVNTYETVIVPILADFTPESVMGLVNHSDSVALFTNAARWAKMDPEKMPALKVAFDVDTWKVLFWRDAKIQEAVDNLDTLTVQVEVRQDYFAQGFDTLSPFTDLEKLVASKLKSVLSIAAKVQIKTPDTLARSEGKTKFVEDRRIME